jgi:hypothetical protein
MSDARCAMAGARAANDSPVEWGHLVPAEEWRTYLAAIDALRKAGLRFLLGGAFGMAAYTGRWRNTKDIDFYILPHQRSVAVEALGKAGFLDYYEQRPYDRGWIYRATHQGVIVDLIWGSPNRRSEVDDLWFARAPQIALRGEKLEVVPVEELLWVKLYVLQKDRSDWPDTINLLYAAAGSLDWEHLITRLDEDQPLLEAMLVVFGWLCPHRVADLPAHFRPRPAKQRPSGRPADVDTHRLRLLDTRPWFAALQPADQPMQI